MHQLNFPIGPQVEHIEMERPRRMVLYREAKRVFRFETWTDLFAVHWFESVFRLEVTGKTTQADPEGAVERGSLVAVVQVAHGVEASQVEQPISKEERRSRLVAV